MEMPVASAGLRLYLVAGIPSRYFWFPGLWWLLQSNPLVGICNLTHWIGTYQGAPYLSIQACDWLCLWECQSCKECTCRMPFLFCSYSHYLTFCLTSRYFHYFCLLSLFLILWSSEKHSIFHLPSFHPSIPTSFTFVFPYSAYMFLCSVSIIIFLPSVHYSLPSFPTLTTQHSIPCDSVSHLLHSPYYTILHITLSPVV